MRVETLRLIYDRVGAELSRARENYRGATLSLQALPASAAVIFALFIQVGSGKGWPTVLAAIGVIPMAVVIGQAVSELRRSSYDAKPFERDLLQDTIEEKAWLEEQVNAVETELRLIVPLIESKRRRIRTIEVWLVFELVWLVVAALVKPYVS